MRAAAGSAVSIVERWADAPGPLDALGRVAGDPHPFARIAGGAGPAGLSRWSYVAARPEDVLAGDGARAARCWDALRARWPRAVERGGAGVPFRGGYAGSLGHELRSTIESVPDARPAPEGFPSFLLARYAAVAAWDHRARRAYVAATAPTRRAARAAARDLRRRIERAPPAEDPVAPRASAARPVVSAARYRARVADVRERIRRGDLFQANLSQRFEGRFAGAPQTLFARLAAVSRAPFLTYVGVGPGRAILSASPERFLALRGARAETRPMKGTRPRGAGAAADRALRAALAASEKDRAELAMIVDLARNDLGRVCRPGTVRVASRRRIEAYPTVLQAVARVEGVLERGRTGVDLVRAAFPPGSVTGAPKVEAMKAIDALEGEPRGPYCGALGWFDEGGDLDLAVAIRTLSYDRGRVVFRVGGGVTLLSDPEEERRETVDKARALLAALGADGGAS